jgi:hypothetical protein
MPAFRVLCATCDRRLGLGEEWTPTQHPGAFECSRCAAERSRADVTCHAAGAFAPPRHVLAGLRSVRD